MYNLYDILLDLCDKRGVTPYRMSKESGISRSIMTELKSGRTQSLSTNTIEKIAKYFDVPIDYLLDPSKSKSEATTPPITSNDLIFALWGKNPNNMTEEDLERVRQFARYIEQEKKGE